MIKIMAKSVSGSKMGELGYVKRRPGIGRWVLPITRYLRAVNAARYVKPKDRLLDIGCGDGYFIRRCPCRERYGLDKRLGDEVKDKLDFDDEYFDYVTMLAVIEHLPCPDETLAEIHRVLKPGGHLVFTTPRRAAEKFIRLYTKDIGEEHESYFDFDRVQRLCGKLFDVVDYRTFLFGLNQVYCLRKK